MSDMYIDDVLTGAGTLLEAKELKNQLINIFAKGGMVLHKWCGNNTELIEVSENYDFSDSSEIKVLGVYWNSKQDCFSFRVKIDLHELNTKRDVLSTFARIYDPLGLLGSVVAKAKIFLQKLRMLKIDWADLLPDTINREWRQFVESFQIVNDININRCIVVEQPEVIELHGFSDAPQSAYGAVVYCKSVTSDGRVLVHLIASKSRVAPTKQTTIPRLELCAAVLLSDFMIVLSWIRKESYQLKTFVANRIATIQEMTSSEQWRYVSTEDNPADFVSRVMDSLKLKTSVRLDIVTDLTSNAFIATLKCFIFRRGKFAKLYYDNATNFVGANIELKKMFNLVCKPYEALASYMASEGIDWKFLPPRAPNFGGLWEEGVKSFKFYLKRVVGNIRLTYEEFLTVIIQIEGMLNYRPLVPLSSDLDDLNVLTPSHFLIDRSITSIVEPDLTNLNENSFQQRNKWQFEKKNAKIGDMVIIKENNLPSCHWSLGRINNIYTGKDSKRRLDRLDRRFLDGRTFSYIFVRGTVTAVRYRDEVCEPYVCLFTGTVGPNFILMDDNAGHIELIWWTNFWKIVRVQYFVRGGFVGHHFRVSSKHLSSLIFRSTVFDSSGVKNGLRCSCKNHVWVSGPTKTTTAVDVRRSDVTALALSYRTFPLRKV
ncbi:integrase catalytic domain-containing protein [Trichonephila clavipes]|nr:integrase catalytic domain-containing protein [Trichonephila clavipes]